MHSFSYQLAGRASPTSLRLSAVKFAMAWKDVAGISKAKGASPGPSGPLPPTGELQRFHPLLLLSCDVTPDGLKFRKAKRARESQGVDRTPPGRMVRDLHHTLSETGGPGPLLQPLCR